MRVKKVKLTEVELAKEVILWLDGWEIYQEVNAQGKRADIVAVKGKCHWVIETKCSFGLAVLDQAVWWLPWADLVSIAVPRRGDKTSYVENHLFRGLGLGMIEVRSECTYNGIAYHNVQERHRPRFQRGSRKHSKRGVAKIADFLCEEQKTYAEAGNNRGDSYTPFKRTCAELRAYLLGNGPAKMTTIMREIDHHYASLASARGAMMTWVKEGKVPGVSRREDGLIVLDEQVS